MTKPAVKVAESAMMKIVCPTAKAIINHQDCPVDQANATPNAALDSMTMKIHFWRPILKAISFPIMDAGTPKKLITPARVVAVNRKGSPVTIAQKPKKATIQLRQANNSIEWAV